jgi:lysophospholipase L1-like esterase
MQGGPSEWDVVLDGALRPKLVLELGAHDYVLASGLPAGVHRVELYKRSEAQNGYTRFLGYDFGAGALLGPPRAAERRIEFVGDSAPAAFGIEGVGFGPDCPGVDYAAHWQNFHLSFAALLAQNVGADLHGTIYSGKGLVRNIWRADPLTMPILYPRANPIDASSTFDLRSFVPDVILLMMGANDFALGQPVDDGPTPLPQFIDALRGLVTTFRSRAPQAHVFLTMSPSVEDAEPEGRLTRTNLQISYDTVASERNAAGDARVYSVAPPVASKSELTGCNGHGNPAFHVRVGQQLADLVKAKTGW